MLSTAKQNMSGYRKGTGRPGGAVREVYVARTVHEDNPRLAKFLESFGRVLGSSATIFTLGSTHLTFLESCGLTPHFRNHGYTPDDIRSFKVALELRLRNVFGRDEPAVAVDADAPLWLRGRNNSIAIRLAADEGLAEERAEIEDFLARRFGELPDLRAFEPHITVGNLKRTPTADERRDPQLLLPEGLYVPGPIALNGLEAYLGRIQ